MNANVEFLNYIYQNSQMGVDTTRRRLCSMRMDLASFSSSVPSFASAAASLWPSRIML